MHHKRKVGANVSNPHSCTTNIMLNSITFMLIFDDVFNARRCVRNVSRKSYYHLYRAYIELKTGKHVVIVNAIRCGLFSFDNEDINLMTQGCQKYSFLWSFDIMSKEELDYYIEMHKK